MIPREELRAEVLRLIGRGVAGTVEPDLFERLALRVFEHQFAENEPYRRFCERRAVAPHSIERWSDIPAVPTAAFKEAPLICGGPAHAQIVFRTSGTTQGPERRGAHYVRDLALYEASALENFRAHMLPDGTQLHFLILGPTPELAPDSSLTWMLDRVRELLATPQSAAYVDVHGLRVEPLLAALQDSEAGEKPVGLLGTAAALVHALEVLAQRRLRFRLPAGSRMMETGGAKGLNREIQRDEFYGKLVEQLGVSEFNIVSEYGMTEMCSQFYDNVLRERAKSRSPELRYKVVPPWVRTRVMNAETLEPAADGEVGVLQHFDLANLDSVAAIQTDDLGVAGRDGFEIFGRASGAELRGCSIAMDQWLSSQR